MMKRQLRQKSMQDACEYVVKNSAYGEWFLIYKLSQNMDSVPFGDLIDDIEAAFRKWDSAKISDEEMHLDAPPPSVATSPIHVNTDLLYA